MRNRKRRRLEILKVSDRRKDCSLIYRLHNKIKPHQVLVNEKGLIETVTAGLIGQLAAAWHWD